MALQVRATFVMHLHMLQACLVGDGECNKKRKADQNQGDKGGIT